MAEAEIHRSLVQIRLEGVFFLNLFLCTTSPTERIYSTGKVTILDSLVVRISACHVEGPGSIPGRGVQTFIHVLLQVNKTTSAFFLWHRVSHVARVAQSVER